MHKLLLSALLTISFSTVSANEAASIAAAPAQTQQDRLHQTVLDYIQSIEDRDLDALAKTMTKGEELVLIFPDSTTLYTRQEYLDFHRSWFADTGWKMELETVYTMIEESFGIVLLKTTYSDDAGPRQALLSLTFALEDGDWRLVFDQNTRIPAD